ncbi:MAG TPA: hypothetical protein VKE94_20400, partial [Gemmataceae bacterium]|nr:hypothetical protein [Gemmataceae bacterium]
MKRTMQLVAMTGLIAALTGGGRTAVAQKTAKNSAAVVKVTAKAEKPDDSGKQVVTITLSIDKDWYAYANPVGLEDLEAAQTVVEITGKNKLESVQLDYPKGKL